MESGVDAEMTAAGTGWTLRGVLQRLEATVTFGDSWPDGRWPVRGDFQPPELEILIGAVLTQNTRWENVVRALEGLRRAGCTERKALLQLPERALAEAVRPSGYFRQKAATLRRLLAALEGVQGVPSRSFLLAIRGVGPETADSILLYAYDLPFFIADAYTRRLLGRLGLVADRSGYEDVRQYCEAVLPRDTGLYRRFHALIVETGKRWCRKRPRCAGCPLQERCPLGRAEGRAEDA
ncbi:MAG: endonuclease [Acidobacteriota bacterium]